MMLALPVIVLNGYKAVRNVNPSLIDMCRSFQGTRRQQMLKIIIPDASPVIFAGLRLGVAAGFIGVVLAELLITPTGIGDLITYHRSVANYAEMYASVVSIILLGRDARGSAGLRNACSAPEKREAVMALAAMAHGSRCAAVGRADDIVSVRGIANIYGLTSKRCAASTSISRAAS